MSKWLTNLKDWIRAFLYALVTILLIKVFLFEAYTIPTTSMEKSLLAGDVVFVNKLTYGPRLPVTPLSIPFTHQNLLGFKPYLDFLQLPSLRFPGSGEIQRNDVLVFNYPPDDEHPIDHKSFYVKRCIGLPGEEIKMADKQLFIDGNAVPDTLQTITYSFRVYTHEEMTSDHFKSLGITEGGMINNKKEYQLVMSRNTAAALREQAGIKKVTEEREPKGKREDHLFPFDSRYSWNRDHNGPLYIPSKGDRIQLSASNISKYLRIIAVYEDNTVVVDENEVRINGEVMEYYEFKQNYYYVLGDSRDNSADSRYWGLVPEDHIIGKAGAVIYSFDKSSSLLSRIRWDRFFKNIH